MSKVIVDPKPLYPVEELDLIISKYPHLRGSKFREAEPDIDKWFKRGGHHYSIRDWRILDYSMCTISGVNYPVYGIPPKHVDPYNYFSVLGSAHSAGVCSVNNYSHFLSLLSNLPAINLSRGGNSPELIARDNLEACNYYLPYSKFVIFEIMSVRSASNSRFAVTSGDMAYDNQAKNLGTCSKVESRPMDTYKELMKSDPIELNRLIRESSDTYLMHAQKIIEHIQRPIIFLWLSQRDPDYFDIGDILNVDTPEYFNSITRFQNSFPMFTGRWICERMIDLARARGIKSALVEVASNTCLGQLAANRFTNEPTTWWNGEAKQSYYPSLYVHRLTATRILRCIQEFELA